VPGDGRGVDPIGLGLLAHAAGEVAHPLRVDDRRWHAARGKRAMRQALVAARGLHDHEAALAAVQLREQAVDAVRVVGDPEPASGAGDMHVEPRLADVEADDLLHLLSLPCLRS
jgi:hypothetical protein